MIRRASSRAVSGVVVVVAGSLLLALSLGGCDRKTPQAPPSRPPTPQAPVSDSTPSSSNDSEAGRLERDLKTKVDAATRELNAPTATPETMHDKLSTYDWTRKQEFLLLMERQMDRISQQVDAMAIRARDSRESTNIKLKQSLDTIESKRKETLSLLRALETGPLEKWDENRETFLTSWLELRQSLSAPDDRPAARTTTAASDPTPSPATRP